MRESTILRPGRNCWRIESADRVRLLVDGADYFHAFRETAKRARRSIVIIGWDVDSRFELERSRVTDGLPTALGDFLNRLVRRSGQLEVYILDWDFAMIYAPDREWLAWAKMDWATHRQLHFRMDSRHPVGASHHQKIVVIDDRVAFAGGLDFALGRWDTSAHRPDDPRRRDNGEDIPRPYHDVQLMVSGAPAAALGELARDRWHTATGERLEVPGADADSDPWPEEIPVDISPAEVAIARTCPHYDGRDEIREVEQLLVDACSAARETIYIENQYFTARKLGDVLARRLEEENAPEIVIVLPQETVGWLSQNTMDVLRERLIRRLQAADRHGRLRIYHPHVPGLGRQCINVHAKVLIIDDELVRVGSANFNNRSMGLDSECDLVIEAGGEARLRKDIAALRNRLLAEHLDVSPAAVAEAVARERSLIRAIDILSGSGRTLRPFVFRVPKELDALVPESQITDPEMPIDGDQLTRQLITDDDRSPARRSLTALASVLIGVLLLAATWRWTPLGEWVDINEILHWFVDLRGEWSAPLIVISVYLVAGLIVFPITLLVVGTGLAFGALHGFVYALLGAELSAVFTFAIGQRLGHKTIRSLSDRWASRVSRRLAQQGLLAIVTLRIVPVAPFSVVNLVAGASHIRFRDFALGTLFGMAPGVFALTVFSDQVAGALAAPETLRITILCLLALLIGAGTWWLGRWLLRRQQGRSGSGRQPGDP